MQLEGRGGDKASEPPVYASVFSLWGAKGNFISMAIAGMDSLSCSGMQRRMAWTQTIYHSGMCVQNWVCIGLFHQLVLVLGGSHTSGLWASPGVTKPCTFELGMLCTSQLSFQVSGQWVHCSYNTLEVSMRLALSTDLIPSLVMQPHNPQW